MKKLTVALLIVLMSGFANANVHVGFNTALNTILEQVDENFRDAVISQYNHELETGSPVGTLSAAAIQRICNAAGWDPKTAEGKKKRVKFAQLLLSQSNAELYFNVCGDEEGTSGGTERCIKDVFTDIEVQVAQAKNLASEYALVKYNDKIICDIKNIRSKGVDDYIRCKSIKTPKIYYEFKFDDAKESNANANQFVQKEFGRGLCLVYGGKPKDVASKLFNVLTNQKDFASSCKNIDCTTLNTKLTKWGYKSTLKDGNCVISYIPNYGKGISEDYYAKFNGKTFSIYHKNSVLKSWKAVSGRGKSPKDSKPTVCQTPKYQACEDIGPTPAGTYYISQNEIQYMDNITVGNFNSNSLRADRSGTAWGKARVKLSPDATTNLFERNADMYIHGGAYWGSSGCIDLTTNIMDFVNWFAQQNEFSTLKVLVDYGNVPELCRPCNGPDCKHCPCKKVINQETNETNCDYI